MNAFVRRIALASFVIVPILVAGVSDASTAYGGYIRCEDIPVQTLNNLLRQSEVSVKANTMTGWSTVQNKGYVRVTDHATTKASFTRPAMPTHAIAFYPGPSSRGFDLSIKRESDDVAALDVAVCSATYQLTRGENSRTYAKASLQSNEKSSAVWSSDANLAADAVMLVLVQPRSINTTTSYSISLKGR